MKGDSLMIKKEEIKERVNELIPELIDSIKEAVSFRSVIDEDNPNYPFGKNIDDCLKSTLNLCESLGFKTYYDKDGYYGYAEVGQGPELVGVLGHLDVVPEGDLNSWTYPPYELTIVDDKIYGRGTQDDKGPTIACIYAVKALLDLGIKLNKRIRFIFGTDEENLWRGINKYKENGEEIPAMGITPDSEFFCINAEKGLLQSTLTCKKSSNLTLSAGNAFNSVPDNATYTGTAEEINSLKNVLNSLNYKYILNENSISVIGKGVHSADSAEGINAISRLAIALEKMGSSSNSIKFIANVIGEDVAIKNLIPKCEDVSGKLTVNVGKIDLNEDIETISLDIRIPVTYKKEDIVNPIKEKALEYGLEYNEFDWMESIYVPADHFLIRTLKEVYDEETGYDGIPESSGGATYARAIDNCVAFGMVFPTSEKTEHQPNEFITMHDLVKATEIYALALYKLAK